MTPDEKKQAVAEAALAYVESGWVIGVGTGSTANHFIDALVKIKGKLDGVVASSVASAERLKKTRHPGARTEQHRQPAAVRGRRGRIHQAPAPY